MPLSSRSDKWASRIVILLQFTAWISIGVVLLQKGASTLRNRSQIEMWKIVQTPERSARRSADNATNIVISEKTKRTTIEENSLEDQSSDREKMAKEFVADDDVDDDDEELSTSFEVHRIKDRQRNTRDKELSKRNHSTVENSMNNDKNVSSIFRLAFQDSYGDKASVVKTEITIDSANVTDSLLTSLDIAWKKQKLRSRVNTGGAAAAIAMVAIGAAMLVVGPVVIVLRALDKRRQERRFSKPSRWDDRPPTYEQATLMSEAPRYSTLNLNVIHEVRVSSDVSSPPSSPVSNRAR